MTNPLQITITEYERLYIGEITKVYGQDKALSKSHFEALEGFVLSNELPNAGNYLKLGQCGNKKYLQAQNYIGVIQLKDGLTIEILPKIARNYKQTEHEKYDAVRDLIVKMLKTLRNSPFKQVNTASLKTQKMPLLEVFIAMFMQETELLIRRGLKNDYMTYEENSPFLKGKLLFSEHIKHNLVHKERFYVAYDNYQANRIENRLIKNTLQLLYKLSRLLKNQQRIREALFVFNEIAPVHDVKVAFSKVKLDRQMKDYEQLLIWCRLFLLGDSFTPHKGKDIAFSLLFDMNTLFESYVGAWLKAKCKGEVSLQDRSFHLAKRLNQEGLSSKHNVITKCLVSNGNSNLPNIGNNAFALKPDIVIKGGVVVADTKWKLLEGNKINQGISSADMYQMFAYASKYTKCKRIVLIYPTTEHTAGIDTQYCFENMSDNRSVTVHIYFFDLFEGFKQQNTCFQLLSARTT